MKNAVFQEKPTVENQLPLIDMVNVKKIVDNAGVLETAFKGNELFEFKKASLKDNTGSMPITLYNELTKYLKEGKCYEIFKVIKNNLIYRDNEARQKVPPYQFFLCNFSKRRN